MDIVFNGRIEEVTYFNEKEFQFIVRVDTRTALLCRLSHTLKAHRSQLKVGDSFKFKGKLYLDDGLTGNNKRILSNKITVVEIQ